jgi:hypothetical protein
LMRDAKKLAYRKPGATMGTKVNVSGLETHVYGLDDVRKSDAHFVDVVFLLPAGQENTKTSSHLL